MPDLGGSLLFAASFLIPLGAIAAAAMTAVGYFKRSLGRLWVPVVVLFLAPWVLTFSERNGFSTMIDIAFSARQSSIVGPVWVAPLCGLGIVFAMGTYRMRAIRESITPRRPPRRSGGA